MANIKTNIRKYAKKTVNILILFFVYFCQALFIVSLKDSFDREKIRNRTLVFLDEGKKRNINIKTIYIFGIQTIFFIIYSGKKRIIFDRLPLGESYYRVSQRVVENKYKVKKILFKNDIPTPIGNVFKHKSLAFDYANQIGYPVVIKPIDGSLSKNVIIDIKNKARLNQSINKIKKYENIFLLEKFIPGDNYRALVIDNKFAGCVMRYPAHIIGDGKNTIRKLINLKNKHPLRGDKDKFNITLYKIEITKDIIDRLKNKGYILNTVLRKNELVFLTDKINASSGVEIYDVTDKVHPKTIYLFEKISQVFDSKLVGIDYISKDIAIPYDKVTSSVIEINSVPYIDLHHFPMKGKSRNVSAHLWDMILGSSDQEIN